MSENARVSVADVRRWLFVSVITKSDVPPDKILAGANVFVMLGGVGVTTSVSVAVHAPTVQDGFVLLTLVGGVIEAVLVTPVCAYACVPNKAVENKKASAIPQASMERPTARHKKGRKTSRLIALGFTKIIPYASKKVQTH